MSTYARGAERTPTVAETAAGPTAGGDLIAEHLADLRKSGLTDDTIATMQVRSLSVDELEKTLGYLPRRAGCRPDHVDSALLIPYPDLEFARYKLFPPALKKDGKEQRYTQGKGTGVHLYIPKRIHPVLMDENVLLYWAEGEKKAAKATQEGFPCIGIPGLWSWLEAGSANGIAELDAIRHVGREEIIVPDSDVWTRPDLLQAVYAFGRELEARGARVRVCVLPSARNGQ